MACDTKDLVRAVIEPEIEDLQAIENMALVNAINEAANRGDSLREIFALVARLTTRMFAGYGATIYLLSEDKNSLEVECLDLPRTVIGCIESNLGKKLTLAKIPLQPGTDYFECLRGQSPRILSSHREILSFLVNVVQAPSTLKNTLIPMIDKLLGLRSVMIVPLVNSGETIGLIDIASNDVFTTCDLEKLKAIARHITVIICRKQMEQQLRWERDFNAKLIECSPALFVAVDAKGHIIMMNGTMLNSLGYEKSEVLGKDFLLTLIAPAYRDALRDTFQDLAEKKRNLVRECRVVAKDGTETIVEWHVQSVLTPDGSLDYYFGIGIDLTERKRLQEQLILADRMAAMGELVSGVAHELNNPLTGVIGFSELLLEKNIPENLCEDVAIVHHEAQRAAEVVKNMLAFARKQSASRQNININSAIARVLSLRTYEHKVNNIKVITHLSHDLPDVSADVFQLQQVFLNIIINAEFFMKQAHNGGVLTISTEIIGGKVSVSIADDGPGISPENIDKIFDPFFTTKEVGVGTGLGLSLAHGIIKEHDGLIYARSKLGEGATFVIELPVQPYRKSQDRDEEIFKT